MTTFNPECPDPLKTEPSSLSLNHFGVFFRSLQVPVLYTTTYLYLNLNAHRSSKNGGVLKAK